MKHKHGGKVCGTHSTCNPLMCEIASIMDACAEIRKYNFGILNARIKSAHGMRSVKIDCLEGCLLLKVRDNCSYQEMHVYAHNLNVAKEALILKIQEKIGLTIKDKTH